MRRRCTCPIFSPLRAPLPSPSTSPLLSTIPSCSKQRQIAIKSLMLKRLQPQKTNRVSNPKHAIGKREQEDGGASSLPLISLPFSHSPSPLSSLSPLLPSFPPPLPFLPLYPATKNPLNLPPTTTIHKRTPHQPTLASRSTTSKPNFNNNKAGVP